MLAMELFAGHHGARNLIDPDRIDGDYISIDCIVVAMDDHADSLDLKTISSAILVKRSSLGLKRIPEEKAVTSKFCSTGVREWIIQSMVESEYCLYIQKRGENDISLQGSCFNRVLPDCRGGRGVSMHPIICTVFKDTANSVNTIHCLYVQLAMGVSHYSSSPQIDVYFL